MRKITVLLADDHAVLRSGLRMLLQAQMDMLIVGEADTGRVAAARARELHPDVVIMDITMPDMSGIEATREIKRASPETAILALTMHEENKYLFDMLNAGASGYVPKRAASDDLVAAVRVVAQGDVFLHPSLAKVFVGDYLRMGRGGHQTAGEEPLTFREQEVLTLVARGLHNRDIAAALTLSVRTVSRHRENIRRKLNRHDRVELVKYAIEKGLVHVTD